MTSPSRSLGLESVSRAVWLAIVLGLLCAACGPTAGSPRPRPRPSERTEFREVTTGQFHSCAITATGDVTCWGRNNEGQLGDGTRRDRETPVWTRVRQAVDVDAGAWQTCATLEGGRARCWGGGRRNVAQVLPRELNGLRGTVRWIAVGETACAIMLRGDVHCWGAEPSGRPIGAGNPYRLQLPSPAIYLDVGIEHLCVLMSANQAQCFHTRTGPSGYVFEPFNPPVQVRNVRQLAASGGHACSTGHGEVNCWGNNQHGQAGNSPDTWLSQPHFVDTQVDANHVTVGWRHSCATTVAGEVVCWGDNSYGQLGDGSRTEQRQPVTVRGIDSFAVRVAAGRDHTCAVTLDREVFCWGRNDQGQLGTGDRRGRLTASRIEAPPQR